MTANKKQSALPAWLAAAAATLAALIGGGASLYAAFATSDLQATQEQEKWQRDAQQAAYAEFYGAIQAEYDSSLKCEEGVGVPGAAARSEVDDSLLGVELFGGEETITLAREAVDNVRLSRLACSPGADPLTQMGKAAVAAMKELKPSSNSMQSLVDAMRNDLGVRD